MTLIPLAGRGGEIPALYALYQRQASAATKLVVLESAIVLVVATAIGPAILSGVSARVAAWKLQAPLMPG